MPGPLQDLQRLIDDGALSADPAQRAIAVRLEALHAALEGYKPATKPGLFRRRRVAPRGVYLYGDVGRGKSMLMDLFFRHATIERKERVHFHDFMLRIHAALERWRQLKPAERAKSPHWDKDMGDDPIPPVAREVADRAWLLCFDEFQVTDVADAMILGRLFEQFFALGLVVVATSNRHPDALYENGLNRQLFLPFIALLKDRLDVVALNSPTDYRLDRLKGVPVYHYPLTEEAASALDDAFLQLTDCKTGTPDELTVQGRTLKVPEAAKGVARFAFADLCEKPLGAADYLALAEAFHTLILAGIPQMDRHRRNEAKRFVTLIDALYEGHVRLVASAAAPPEALYEAGDGAFEFQRTVSRLMEMQSETYLTQHEAQAGEPPA
ncbi:MAG: cell division protein ZapE [Pseudomonadota bacterium]